MGTTVAVRPFIAQLARAMQAAAEQQREASNAEIHAITTAHLKRVRARAIAEAEELRRMARQDIDAINAWQEAEAERIRAEAARRIVVRGEQLDGTLVRHSSLIETEVEQIEDVVAHHQLELDEYFDRLTTEASPGVIARLADQLPELPDLARVGGDARAKALTAMAAEGDPPAADAPAPDAPAADGPTFDAPAADAPTFEAPAPDPIAAGQPEPVSASDAAAADQPGPELVPVMDPGAAGTGGATDAGNDAVNVVAEVAAGTNDANDSSNHVNGDGQARGNPAMRLLRTITTRPVLTMDAPANGAAGEAPSESTNGATGGVTDGVADPFGGRGVGGDVSEGTGFRSE